jgi:DNA polymerase III subunit gamma/tau
LRRRIFKMSGQFIVSARKYRPTHFDEVVGQNHIAKTLRNALQTNQLAHAFLFCGPRGVGKTTCARILAKVINCENPINNSDPCNQCKSCLSFSENASFNIFELDAASNNSVDHIRNLIEQVRFQPQSGTHKVFIIDEVHMLSTQAFNAFLKTLEEPPSYAIFILATTERHKILPTILSRCQVFDFKRIQAADIAAQLKSICQKENREYEPEALHLIAAKADGAMRDALSIFDRIASSGDGKILYKEVVESLNILDYDYFFRIVDYCIKSDLPKILLEVAHIINHGFEAEQIVEGLSVHLRELMICKNTETLSLLEYSEELKQRFFNQATALPLAFILSALDILNQCDLQLQRARNKRLALEIALSKLVYLSQSLETNIFEIDKKKT